jgi:hypothetical protein
MSTALSDTTEMVRARERIALAVGLAVFVSGVVLVIAILPAEFGIDPTGLGRRLGLSAMSELRGQVQAFEASGSGADSTQRPVVGKERPFQNETATFTIGPRDFIEYKYRLELGESLLFSWASTDRVNVELHAEPDGAPRGYAESYEKKNDIQTSSGTLNAPFAGIHGWYWENTTDRDVTVTVSAAGYFNMSYEFRKDTPPKIKTFP